MNSDLSGKGSSVEKNLERLESKKYNFLVDGTMPVLEFDITPGRARPENEDSKVQHLRLELYNPLAGEIFEAKFSKGRIEVDNDGSITYFSTSTDSVNLSLFLGHNLSIKLHKDGTVQIKSPSKIMDIETNPASKQREGKKEKSSKPASARVEPIEISTDYLSFTLK